MSAGRRSPARSRGPDTAAGGRTPADMRTAAGRRASGGAARTRGVAAATGRGAAVGRGGGAARGGGGWGGGGRAGVNPLGARGRVVEGETRYCPGVLGVGPGPGVELYARALSRPEPFSVSLAKRIDLRLEG